MSKWTITAIAVAIGFMLSVGSDKARCESLSGNPNEACMVAAKGKERVARANLEIRNKNTKQARYQALVTKAEADYWVAKGRCDGRAGKAKDACVQKAKAAVIFAKVDAKSLMKLSKANKRANEKYAEARNERRDTATD